MVTTVAVVMAIIVPIRGGAAVEDVEWDVARRWAKDHQAALAQRGLVIATVTEGTLLQTAWQERERERQ